ncbi:hypothetical protein MFIFM68171_11016 [Madurella fahalii]|uniref:Uncharacterized protein n=1 Tax=Madurella fahalii TaxID=1157608 RepID=A0ABQ0GSU2_9PEZI
MPPSQGKQGKLKKAVMSRVGLKMPKFSDRGSVNGRQQSPASSQLVPAGPPIGEDGLQATAPDGHDSDAQIQQDTGREKERPADAEHQSQRKGADQEQVSQSGSELSSELRQVQENAIATVLHDCSTLTISSVGDAESIHSRKSSDGEDRLAMVVYQGVDALDSVEAADTVPQPNPMNDLDPDRCRTPATLNGGRIVFQDASNIYGLIEEFLTEHKISKKAGYDWFTTLLDWTSELKGRRDAELADLGRGNAKLREKLREDAGEKKRLLNEVKLMTDVASKRDQELAQANLKLEYYSRDLNISKQKLRGMEESKHAIEKTLNQCQIELSATAGQSVVYKDELEKSKKELEVNRKVLQDVRVELETGQRHNNDLNSHIKTLSKNLENERRKHREEITQYSQLIESIEQERRDAEDAAAKEEVELNNVIQSTKRELATLNAAYERQKVEHAEAIQTLQAKHGGQIQELRKEHAEIIRMLQLEHDGLTRDLKGEHAEEMRRLRSQHSCQTQDLREEHSRKVEGLELQVTELKTSRDEEVKRLNDQILQENKAHREQLDKLQAEGDRKVKTEVEKAMKKQQQRIEALQGTIVGSQDRYYVQISDSAFVQLLESISQQITNLSAGVGRPSTHLFDKSLDPTNYLDQNPHERDRSWTIFVRSVCWSVILAGFFEFPLGFGCLGSLGEGFERLYHLYLLFSRPTSDGSWKLPSSLVVFANFLTGTSLEFPGDKATNVWRASFFDAFLKAVKANPNPMQQHEGSHTYPGMFKANVDRVVKALTDKLLRLSNRQLDSRVPAQIFKVVYDMGILSLQMGSQRAHVMLEPCESGDLVRAGDRFADEGGLTGVDTAVGLMMQPCMVRIGDGSNDTTSEHIIVKGRFISS